MPWIMRHQKMLGTDGYHQYSRAIDLARHGRRDPPISSRYRQTSWKDLSRRTDPLTHSHLRAFLHAYQPTFITTTIVTNHSYTCSHSCVPRVSIDNGCQEAGDHLKFIYEISFRGRALSHWLMQPQEQRRESRLPCRTCQTYASTI